MNKNKAYEYCVTNIKKKSTPKYVKKQMKDFMEVFESKNDKYVFNFDTMEKIEKIFKLLVMPKGEKSGETLYECTTGYQWLLYSAILCVVHREDTNKRRYSNVVLEIARKNFKTYTVATIFILLLILEPPFSEFYSVSADKELAKRVREAVHETLLSSKKIYNSKKGVRFKIMRDKIIFTPKNNSFIPLANSNNRLDGRQPSVFLADEVGALTNNYPVEAMRSGQMNLRNKLGCIISTKYPKLNNVFEEEIARSKLILDGFVEDETTFSLLYEPDKTKKWRTDDNIIFQSNPVALENESILEEIKKKRQDAILQPSKKENFLTKHLNIMYQGTDMEQFCDIESLRKCKVENIDWNNREVYIGVDLALSVDNCSVSMVTQENGKLYVKSWCFIPEDKIEEKEIEEKIPYKQYIAEGNCFACGSATVDYSFIEGFVFEIEKKYNVRIMQLGADPWNATSCVNHWENGKKGYNNIQCVMIRQHSDTLHAPTKLFKEKILNGDLAYENNQLFELNMTNAKTVYDTNMNYYINKKKSRAKIDMVMATINAIYLLNNNDNVMNYEIIAF